MSLALSDLEIDCLKKLAELFEQGKPIWTRRDGLELISLTKENYEPVLRTFERYGFINEILRVAAGPNGIPIIQFAIDASAVQTVREIREEEAKEPERENIVEQAKAIVGKHRVWGWVALVFVVLGMLITFANQLISLLKGVGVMR